ncbi:zinc ribbon domain-containing protein [Roseofilum reptotaenium CS-1145]|uniref:zinc ribbon domain-containing protein n=1 Tax=Roseofilum reptotaenium TaxID=1233427 RepID=UPI00232F22BF|nr:zinc ribbon domain-containing protein [Roseofilum reptotaenium CS-1145]
MAKEDARGSSQECPDCGAKVAKSLSDRWHQCSCGCSMPRDVASGLVYSIDFKSAVGRTVLKMPLETVWRGCPLGHLVKCL